MLFSATDDKYFATCGSDGVLHLWTTDNLEHLQFQVIGQVRQIPSKRKTNSTQ